MRKSNAIPFAPRKTYAVVVDGECEVWYLRMLQRNERSLRVNIEPQIPQKKSIADQYQMVAELSAEYTKVFWVVDFDVIVSQSRQAKTGAKTPLQLFKEHYPLLKTNYKNVVIIVNNPCIEFWFLLHHEETSKYFHSCSSVENHLKKHLKDYEKTQKYFTKENNDIYKRLRPLLNVAIKHSKKLGDFNLNQPVAAMAELHHFFEAKEFSGHFNDNNRNKKKS
jgi:hypothetical protein